MKKVLTIAGSDSCGGAGIQADIKAMSAQGVYAMSVITAVTAQNSMGVFAVQEIDIDIIKKQIEVLYSDIEIDAVKIGMLSTSNIIKAVSETLKNMGATNIIIDPVMISKSGYYLLKNSAIDELKKFISQAMLVTPNIPEAEVLANMKICSEEDMIIAANIIKNLGAKNVLIKGGHRNDNCTDILLNNKNEIIKFSGIRFETKNTHGTGCTLSSTIAAYLGKGFSVEDSIQKSKEYISQAIKNSFEIGAGVGPVGHFIDIYNKADIQYK